MVIDRIDYKSIKLSKVWLKAKEDEACFLKPKLVSVPEQAIFLLLANLPFSISNSTFAPAESRKSALSSELLQLLVEVDEMLCEATCPDS